MPRIGTMRTDDKHTRTHMLGWCITYVGTQSFMMIRSAYYITLCSSSSSLVALTSPTQQQIFRARFMIIYLTALARASCLAHCASAHSIYLSAQTQRKLIKITQNAVRIIARLIILYDLNAIAPNAHTHSIKSAVLWSAM